MLNPVNTPLDLVIIRRQTTAIDSETNRTVRIQGEYLVNHNNDISTHPTITYIDGFDQAYHYHSSSIITQGEDFIDSDTPGLPSYQELCDILNVTHDGMITKVQSFTSRMTNF